MIADSNADDIVSYMMQRLTAALEPEMRRLTQSCILEVRDAYEHGIEHERERCAGITLRGCLGGGCTVERDITEP